MQFCQNHWDQLRESIKASEVGHLIASSGEEMEDRFAVLAEHDEGTSYGACPLLDAHNAIVNSLASKVGMIALIKMNCPLCDCELLHAEECEDPECPIGMGADEFSAYYINWTTEGAVTYYKNGGYARWEKSE